MLFVVTKRERTGVLVLRIWTETDQTDSVRARITTDSDRRTEARMSVAGGSVDEVVELVRSWVVNFVARQAAGGNQQ
jgi:hypothetical protein